MSNIRGYYMKKLRSFLLILVALLLIVGGCHTIVSYIGLSGNHAQGAPAWVAVVNLVPYLLTVVVCFVAYAVLGYINKKNNLH